MSGTKFQLFKKTILSVCAIGALGFLNACADASVPGSRSVDIPAPVGAESRRQAINERPDSVMYLPLGEDVLVPEQIYGDPMPQDAVGPFELRNETVAGALQLILADYDISLAFETEEGFDRTVTVANLQGELERVIRRVCSLANLYCSYEDGALIVKDEQTFTVTIPPIGGADDSSQFLNDIASGLSAVLGGETDPNVDTTTRTIIYAATQRNSEIASRYFQRLRANTAMVIFETYIWEVSLDSGNTTGINWSALDDFGKFNVSFELDGQIDSANFTNPISIGLPTTQSIGANPTDVVDFLSRFGAVKSISQPQIAVLSGSSAELRVAETENYVAEVTTTLNGEGSSSTSVNTDSVDSGFTLNIGSTWDRSTVYANIDISLTNVLEIESFPFSDGGAGGTTTSIQLPQTTERELSTQVRVRPGDSVLIAGLVNEQDNFNKEGIGFMDPVIPQSRTARTENVELVILLRPRVVAYTTGAEQIARMTQKAKAQKQVTASVAQDVTYSSQRPATPLRLPRPSAVSRSGDSDDYVVNTQTAPSPSMTESMTEPVTAPVIPNDPVSAPEPEPEPLPILPEPTANVAAPVIQSPELPAPPPVPSVASVQEEVTGTAPVIPSVSSEPIATSPFISSAAPDEGARPDRFVPSSRFQSRYLNRGAVSSLVTEQQSQTLAAPRVSPDVSIDGRLDSPVAVEPAPVSESPVQIFSLDDESEEVISAPAPVSSVQEQRRSSGIVSPSAYY